MPPSRELAVSSCQRECRWRATGGSLDGERLFACLGCGSEWVASQEWTPVDWLGEVPPEVAREREGAR